MSSSDLTKKPYSSKTILNSIVAGYSAGICGTIVGHPLDSLKVLMQTNNHQSVRCASTLKSNKKKDSGCRKMSTLTSSVKQNSNSPIATTTNTRFAGRSIRALYAGISGPLVTVGATQALMFSVYDTTRRCLYSFTNGEDDSENYFHNDSFTNVFCSAVVAGATMSIATGPMQIIKTKQQIMVWSFQRAVKDTSSLSKLFVGYRLHAFCSGLGRGIYMTTYESTKRFLAKHSEKDGNKITLGQRAFCAASSGTLCWALIFPADVVRCRMYAQSISKGRTEPVNPQGAWDVAKTIYHQSGNSIRPFYRGFGVTVLRAGSVAAFVLPIYDLTLEYLQKNQR